MQRILNTEQFLYNRLKMLYKFTIVAYVKVPLQLIGLNSNIFNSRSFSAVFKRRLSFQLYSIIYEPQDSNLIQCWYI